MEFSNDYVVYKNLNSNNDFIEINFQITSKLFKTKEFPPLTINLNNLVINTLVEEILLFSANTFLKLMYIVTQNDFNENSNKNKNNNNNFNKNSSNRDFLKTPNSNNKNNFFSIFHNLNSSNPFSLKNLNSNSEYNYKTNDPINNNNNKKGFFSKILSHNHSSNKITNKNNDQPTLLNNKTPSTNNNSSINSYEIIESNSIDSDKINIKDIKNDNNINKNFCVGIFIAGLHKKTSNLIENSNGFPACCNHSECAILQSMTAEILDKYLIKNQKIEINSFLANMCFPLGIKNCYKCIFTENGI